MNMKLLLGSLLVLTLLFLMPSIPAIQQQTIKEKDCNDFIEQLDFKDIKDLIESGKLDEIKHPILYVILKNWLNFRLNRGVYLIDISSDSHPFGGGMKVHNLLIFIRGLWLGFTGEISLAYLQELSNKYGWNWKIWE